MRCAAANCETVSPAMDIQMAYNLERMLFFASGRDAPLIRSLMAQVPTGAPAQILTVAPRPTPTLT